MSFPADRSPLGRERDRLAAAVALALVSCLRLSAGQEDALQEESELRPFAWCAPEVASGHISTGRVKVTHPVHNFDSGLGVEYAPVGYVLAGVWSLTDLSREYLDVRSAFWNEIDPVVTCGRRQPLFDGYSFDSSVGAQWNYMAGYEGDAQRSYDEWQLREVLSTPYVSPWFSMRNFYWPVVKASFRVGVKRNFRITDNLTLAPNVWLDGGSARWNRQRFGYRNADRIGQGLNSLSVRLFAHYRLFAHTEIFGGVTGYCVVDDDIRSELKSNPSDEARYVYALVTCGISVTL